MLRKEFAHGYSDISSADVELFDDICSSSLLVRARPRSIQEATPVLPVMSKAMKRSHAVTNFVWATRLFISGPRKLDTNIPAKVIIAVTMKARPIPVTKPIDSSGVNVV
jgi:hypothetical protein